MKEILLNPGVLALLGVMFTGTLTYFQSRSKRSKSFTKSTLTLDQKKTKLLRWNQERYHQARMLLIQNGLGDLVDKYLPFDPPEDLMIRDEENDA